MSKLNYIRALLLSALCALTSAHARVNVYDSLTQGDHQIFGLKATCAEELKSIDRSVFKTSDLTESTVKLSQLNLGTTFFHYTNADVLKKILRSEIEDREEAQQLTNYDSIFNHVFQPQNAGLGGLGWYFAANPISSISFGNIQIRVKLNENTNVLTSKHLLHLVATNLLRFNPLLDCLSMDVLKLVILQENDISMLYYDESYQWFTLVDELPLQQTAIIETRPGQEAFSRFLIEGHANEVSGSQNDFFNKVNLYIKSPEELWAIYETAKKHRRQDLLNALVYYPFMRGDQELRKAMSVFLSKDPMDIEFMNQIPQKEMCSSYKAFFFDFPERLKKVASRNEIQKTKMTFKKICPDN